MPNDQVNTEAAAVATAAAADDAAGQTTETTTADEAAAAGDEGDEGEEGDTTTGGAADDKESDKKAKKSKWVQRRFDELTGEKNNAIRENENLKKQTETLLSELAAAKSGDGKGGLPATEIDRLATEKAKTLAASMTAEQQFNEKCDRVFDQGAKEFPDFKESVENLKQLGKAWENSVSVIVEALDDPHKVIQHLSKDLDEADRILSLPQAKQIAALTKLEISLATPKPAKAISKANDPITTVDGSKSKAAYSPSDTKKPIDQWIAERNADLRKRGKRL